MGTRQSSVQTRSTETFRPARAESAGNSECNSVGPHAPGKMAPAARHVPAVANLLHQMAAMAARWPDERYSRRVRIDGMRERFAHVERYAAGRYRQLKPGIDQAVDIVTS